MRKANEFIVGIIGLGYVGLPLASILSKKFDCVGFDISQSRVNDLVSGVDRTGELKREEFDNLDRLLFTSKPEDLQACNFYIVTVPTPINSQSLPDFGPLKSASLLIGSVLKPGDIVVYESTVYPGATEEVCVPILESHSGLRAGIDFFYGYSPERINPGDSTNRVENILKITSGCNDEIAEIIDGVYGSVISAGTFKASSVRVAEAAKVIENAQRDVNIAFMNEIAKILGNLGIDTTEVLEAASTKWNFMRFSPGLVGGHCIGVDPYYLIKKAEDSGYDPQLLKISRATNESVPQYIADRLFHLTKSDLPILILGATFKENCPDLRNSKVKDLFNCLVSEGYSVTVVDPVADEQELRGLYGNVSTELLSDYGAIVLAVAHDEFIVHGSLVYEDRISEGGVIFDVKSKVKHARDGIKVERL
jgi:UDP-N-acetyl-D-galactosamine dehydrogenase